MVRSIVGPVHILKEGIMKRYRYPLHTDNQLAWWFGVTAIIFGFAATIKFYISDGFGVGVIIFGAMFMIGVAWTYITWYVSDEELHRDELSRRDRERKI
jgi:hypothetical protein